MKMAKVLLLAFADLAFAVEVPDRLRQRSHNIRPLSLEDVVHMVHGGDIALAALQRTMDAQQPDNVASVGVEKLPGVRAIDPNAMNLRRVIAEVLDSRDMSASTEKDILRDTLTCTWPRMCPLPFWLTKYPR